MEYSRSGPEPVLDLYTINYYTSLFRPKHNTDNLHILPYCDFYNILRIKKSVLTVLLVRDCVWYRVVSGLLASFSSHIIYII